MSTLAAQDLSIGYRHARRAPHLVAEHLQLELTAGEFVCLLGPNGTGKSTLVRTLSGMQPPLSGQVLLDGVDIHGLAPHERALAISIVLTERIDAGHLTVRTLVELGRYPHTDWVGALTSRDEAAVQTALAATGALELADRPLAELSDGERQKVMISRALAQDTSVILLDEPTAFLDLPRRVETIELLRRLAGQTQKAILLSTHDLDLALRSADRIWLLDHGQIRIGLPEELVLDGAFGQVFQSRGVRFDADSGAFRVIAVHGEAIAVHGEGGIATWTARALERIGYNVIVNGTARRHITIDGSGRDVNWTCRTEEGEFSYDSLDELVSALRRP